MLADQMQPRRSPGPSVVNVVCATSIWDASRDFMRWAFLGANGRDLGGE